MTSDTPSQAARAGWKLVPVTATDEMLGTLLKRFDSPQSWWQALLAASPAPPAEALPAGVDVHEVGRDDLKRRAVKLLERNGWKPGDQFSAHSTTELMVALATDAVKNPPDRCAWPECGCCHDASCNEAALTSAPAPEDRTDRNPAYDGPMGIFEGYGEEP